MNRWTCVDTCKNTGQLWKHMEVFDKYGNDFLVGVVSEMHGTTWICMNLSGHLSKYYETFVRIQIWLAINRNVFKVCETSGKVLVEQYFGIFTEMWKTLFKRVNIHGPFRNQWTSQELLRNVWCHMERCLEKSEMRRKVVDASISKYPGLLREVQGISRNRPDMLEHVW